MAKKAAPPKKGKAKEKKVKTNDGSREDNDEDTKEKENHRDEQSINNNDEGTNGPPQGDSKEKSIDNDNGKKRKANDEDGDNSPHRENVEDNVKSKAVMDEPSTKDAAEGEPKLDLTKPIKRARTAYFIFSDERRADIQGKHKGEGVAVVARELGQLWQSMPAKEKAVYQEKAALEREQVAQQLEQIQAAGIDLGTLPGAATMAYNNDNNKNSNSGATDGNAHHHHLVFPLVRIKKITKLDPEVRGLSKEALLLVTACAEMVTGKLGIEAVRVAQIQNRRKLLPDDVAQVCQTREQFLFLREDVKDLVREQVVQKQHHNNHNKEKDGSSKDAKASSDSKPLTDYFPAKGT